MYGNHKEILVNRGSQQFGSCLLDSLGTQGNSLSIYYKHTTETLELYSNDTCVGDPVLFLHASQCPLRVSPSPNAQKDISIAACVMIQSLDRKLLLTQRAESLSIFPNAWVFPGGKADPNETLEQTAIREVYEETGISLYSLSPYLFYESVYPTSRAPGPTTSHCIILFFISELPYTSTEVRLCVSAEEIASTLWVSESDFKNPSPRIEGIYPNSLRQGIGEGHYLCLTRYFE